MGVSCSSAKQNEDARRTKLTHGQRRSFGGDEEWKNRSSSSLPVGAAASGGAGGGGAAEKKKGKRRRRFGTMPLRRSRSAGAAKAREEQKDGSKFSRDSYHDFISTLASKRPRAPSIHSPRPNGKLAKPQAPPLPEAVSSSARAPHKQHALSSLGRAVAGRERAFSDGGLDMTTTHTALPVSRSRTPSLSCSSRRSRRSRSISLSRTSSANTMRATPSPPESREQKALPSSPSSCGLSSPAIVWSSPGKAQHGGPNTIVHHLLEPASDSDSDDAAAIEQEQERVLATLSRHDTRRFATAGGMASTDENASASSDCDSDSEDAGVGVGRAPSRASATSSEALASPNFHASLPPPPRAHPDGKPMSMSPRAVTPKPARVRRSLTTALGDVAIRPVSAFGPHTRTSSQLPSLSRVSPRAMTPAAVHTFSPRRSIPGTPKTAVMTSPSAAAAVAHSPVAMPMPTPMMSPMQLESIHASHSLSRRSSLSRGSSHHGGDIENGAGAGFYMAHDPSRYTSRRASQHALEVARTRTRTPSLPIEAEVDMHQAARQSVAARVRSKSVNLRALRATGQVPHAYAHAPLPDPMSIGHFPDSSSCAAGHSPHHQYSPVPSIGLPLPPLGGGHAAAAATRRAPVTPRSEFGAVDSAYDTEPTTEEEDAADLSDDDEDAELPPTPMSNKHVHRPAPMPVVVDTHAGTVPHIPDHDVDDSALLYNPNVYVNEVKRQQKKALYSQSTVFARPGVGYHGVVDHSRSPTRSRVLASPSVKIANVAKGALASPQKAAAVDSMASIFQQTLSPPMAAASSPSGVQRSSDASPAPASPLMSSKKRKGVVEAEVKEVDELQQQKEFLRQPSFKLRVVSTRGGAQADASSGTPEFMQVRKSIIMRRQSDPNLAKAQLRANRARALNDFSHRRGDLNVTGSPTPSADSPPMMPAPVPASAHVPYKQRPRHMPMQSLDLSGATPERISRTIDRSASTRPACASLSPPSRKTRPGAAARAHAHPSQFNKPPRRPPRPAASALASAASGSRSGVAPSRRPGSGSYHSGQIVTMPDGSKAIMTGSRTQSLRRPAKPAKPAKPQKIPTMPSRPASRAAKPVVPAKPSMKPSTAKPSMPAKPAKVSAKSPTRPRQAPAKPAKPSKPMMKKPAYGAVPAKPALPGRRRASERSFKEEDFDAAAAAHGQRRMSSSRRAAPALRA